MFDKVEWDAMMRLTEEAEQKFAAPVRARSQCGFQLACRHVPKTKRNQPRLDLDTGRELRNDKAKFYRAIGAKLFLVQKGWIKLLLKASLAFNRDDYYDRMVGSMRAAGALELQSPAFGGSAPFGEAMFVI